MMWSRRIAVPAALSRDIPERWAALVVRLPWPLRSTRRPASRTVLGQTQTARSPQTPRSGSDPVRHQANVDGGEASRAVAIFLVTPAPASGASCESLSKEIP